MPRRKRSPSASRREAPALAAQVPWLVYILRCADGTLYTGCTNDLARRLRAHHAGQVKYTRGRLPVEAIYQEPAPDRSRAQIREAQIKRLSRQEKLDLPPKGRT